MQLAAHVGVRRTGAGIYARHASVAHGGEDHSDHGDQNRGDYVALAGIAINTIGGMGAVG